MQGRRHGRLTAEQKQLAFRLGGRGWRLVDIAREIGCTASMVGVTRSALENAASVAGMILSTEALVTDLAEDHAVSASRA